MLGGRRVRWLLSVLLLGCTSDRPLTAADLVGTWEKTWVDDSRQDELGEAVDCMLADFRLAFRDDGTYTWEGTYTPQDSEACPSPTQSEVTEAGQWGMLQADASEARYLLRVRESEVEQVSRADDSVETYEDLDVVEFLHLAYLWSGDRSRELYLGGVGVLQEVDR